MRSIRFFSVILVGLAGCATGGGASTAPSAGGPPARSGAPSSSTAKRSRFTKENNPTTQAGRGEPSLEDADRPAAWVLIDGQAGKFSERDGRRMIEWTVDGVVGSTPTFRVERYEPLLGDARDLKCIISNLDSNEGTQFIYGIAAKPGTFETGQDYSLVSPGDNFTIHNRATGDMIREIAPLAPGKYALAASLENTKTGKKAAAVTYFTVGEAK